MTNPSTRRAWVGRATVTVLLTAAFAGYLALCADDPLGALASAWDKLLVVAILVWAAAVVSARAAHAAHARAAHGLARDLSAFRSHPPPRPLCGSDHLATFGPLGPELEALCASYRHALNRLVAQGEALESLRLLMGRDGERSFTATVIQRGLGSSRNMVARFTPSLRWTHATPALLHFLGVRPGDLTGRPLADLVHPDDFPHLETALSEALDTGEAHGLVFRVRCRAAPADSHPEPRERHVQMDVAARYGDNGSPAALRCFLLDVSDRVRAEQELRRRTEELQRTNEHLLRVNDALQRLKESYRDLYHNAPAMYFSLDDQGCFVGCNDTLLATLGYGRDDLHQRPYTLLLPPDSRCDYLRDPNTFQQAGELETRWLKRDGSVIDVWIRTVPVLDSDGRFLRSRSAAQDVTERNRLAGELRRRGDELERANAELRQINKELDEFTSVVTHDLKEPLRTIELHGSALAADYAPQLGPDCFESLNHILTASRRLGKLIDDLLALCRAGRFTTAPRPFHLAEAVATVRRDLAGLLSRRGATVRTEGTLPAVLADPERITQLLLNLVANGLKYNQSERPCVTVGARENGEPARVTVFVRDNGIGIAAEYQQEIFGIFRRLHGRDEYEGTGAGLAICKKIVEAHSGRLWVESEPGAGATFYFTLPRAANGAPALPPAAQVPARQREGASILLVEDMPEIAVVVRRLAERAGHRLDWVSSAEAALELLRSRQPDLLLLDINLPGMNGVELCRRLRASNEHAGLPVALFSDDTGGARVMAGRAAGADFVLSKGLLSQPDDWGRRLEEILRTPVQGAPPG